MIRSLLIQAVFLLSIPLSIAAQSPAPLFDEVRLKGGESTAVNVAAQPADSGMELVLAFKARVDFEKPAGCNAALELQWNGQPVEARRLLNKPQRALSRGGDVYSLGAGERLVLFYSPDYTAPDSDPHYGLADGYPACVYEMRVTDLVKAGTNTLSIANRADAQYTIVLGEAHLISRPAALPEAAMAKETGPLPRVTPAAEHCTDYAVAQQDAGIALKVGGETFDITSRFSTPAAQWETGSNSYFDHQRELRQTDEAVLVRDTFTNKTSEPLPLMHRHEAALAGRLSQVWLGGLRQPDLAGRTSAPMNPTLCAVAGGGGFGLLPVDDVFRIHAHASAESGTVGLADDHLVLAPGATYTSEWAIVPVAGGDYWEFINASRRLLDVNFTIDGGFAFLRNGPLIDAWSDTQLADFIRFKDAKYLCASIAHPMYNGTYSHGTSFQRIALDSYTQSFERWRRLAPGRECLVYFHCFIDVVEDGPERFADARHVDATGQHLDYGNPVDRLYVPTAENSFGPAVEKNVDLMFDTIGADGVYWDEQEYSRFLYTYAEPWDGYSGDIDPATMKLTRLKSSTTLLSEHWRLALAKKILSRGSLVGNSPCLTKARRDLRFPCFVETGSISNCTQAHLYSPIALGDHLTERSEQDAYGVMLAALDFGCVYHWYNDMTVIPSHPTLTSYMFPITPVELHEGYIIGKERILTNRSGVYGWGDASAHEVHVFNTDGVETAEHAGKGVELDGQTFTELRLPTGWSAAIVRR